MRLDIRERAVAVLSFFFMLGAHAGSCPFGTVDFHVTTTADVPHLADLIDCSGEGSFNVTWYGTLPVDQTIEVSNHKNVTVTGLGFPTIYSGIHDKGDVGENISLATTFGLFSVVNGSTLSLNEVVLEGGSSEEGGAVAVHSSSSLYVVDCDFTNNSASNGGETVKYFLRHTWYLVRFMLLYCGVYRVCSPCQCNSRDPLDNTSSSKTRAGNVEHYPHTTCFSIASEDCLHALYTCQPLLGF